MFAQTKGIALLIGAAIACASITIPRSAHAHPPANIVVDANGVIYFSDLSNVWMVTPEGRTQIAIAGVHTHELWLGPDQSLYGDDVQNEGDNYRFRIFRLLTDGQLINHQDWITGHPSDHDGFFLQRDAKGNQYRLNRTDRQIEMTGVAGVSRSVDLSELPGHLHWMVVNHDGSIHVSVGSSLYHVASDSNSPTIAAADLVERKEEFNFVHDRHALMGMWTDSRSNVFVADFAGMAVKKVQPDGGTGVAYESETGWSPVAGAMGLDGSIVVQEWSTSNSTRIVRVSPSGKTEILADNL